MKKIFAITIVLAALMINITVAHAQYQASPEQISLGTVHWTEGIEHSFIRQLINDPSIADGTPNEFKGGRNDTKAVKHWADATADIIACEAGYRDCKFGGEVRVALGDSVAYVIHKTAAGKLIVAEYPVPKSARSQTATSTLASSSTPPSTIASTATHYLAATVVTAGFMGATKEGKPAKLPAYEYAYLG
jgi:hypothetical protein